MKNSIIKLSSAFALVALLASCSPDTTVYSVDGGQSLVGFNEKTSELLVFSAADLTQTDLAGYDNSVTIHVGSTIRTNQDRTYTVAINQEFTTADPSQYTVQSTFTIPAGEFVGTIKITGNYAALPSDWSAAVLSYDLTEVQGNGDKGFNADKITTAINLKRGCIQTPHENYTGYITSSSGSSAAPFDVKFVKVKNVFNTWTVTNLWGDLVAAATNNPGYAGQYPYPAQLRINCDNKVDIYGTRTYAVPSTGGGTYYPSSGQLTVSFGNSLFTSGFITTVDLFPND